MIPHNHREHTTVLVVYDLRDPDAWQRAHDELEVWGREMAKIHALGLNHIVIEFLPGGALGASA